MLTLKRIISVIIPSVFIFGSSYALNTETIGTPGINLLPQAKLLSSMKLDTKLTFVVHLNVRNKTKFNQLFKEIYDPNSPRYHQYLTTAEYQSEFAPDASLFETVKKYFLDKKMAVKIQDEDLHVTATIHQIEQSFKIKMNYYSYHNKTVFSNSKEPEIDAEIAQYISGIAGLNNLPRFHHMVLSTPRAKQAKKSESNKVNQNTLLNLGWDSFLPKAVPTDTSLNGFTGTQLRTTYNIAAIPTVNGTTLDGTGQTIVILDEWGRNDAKTIRDDMNKFSTLNNLPLLEFPSDSSPGNFSVTDVAGHPYQHDYKDTDQGWTDEIAIDLTSTHTIAPNANLVLVLNNNLDISAIITNILNSSDVSFAGFPNAYTLSNSWGGTEYSDPTLEMNLQKAAMKGMSVNFSSSDCGDGSYNSSWPCSIIAGAPVVDYPASSALATAVGGSSLFVDASYNYSFESGWGSYQVSPAGFFAGSTGGISQMYPAPPWQNNSTFQSFTAGGYGVIGDYQGGGMRAVPDISMLADIHTGIISYYTGGCESGCIFGGTSVACPLYTATLALINQARFLQNSSPIGLSAQYLYTMNQAMAQSHALNVITPPHQIINNQNNNMPNPAGAPNYAFTLLDQSIWYPDTEITFNWDSSLTMNENQFWNDVVGVGSPNLPVFIPFMTAQL